MKRRFIRHLRDLVKIPSPSTQEERVREHCSNVLSAAGCEVVESGGNLMAKKGLSKVVLAAHMDTIQGENDVEDIEEGEWPLFDVRMGYDDKVGIAMILSLAEVLPDLRCILTVEEEIGRLGAKRTPKEWFDGAELCVCLDRGGLSDLVTSVNGFRTISEQDADILSSELDEVGFFVTEVSGRNYDGQVWASILPCVNLSVGIYERHTPDEYVVIWQAMRTLEALKAWLPTRRQS